MASNKPFQIYPNDDIKQFIKDESERLDTSMNKAALAIIERSMKAKKARAK